MQSSKGGQAATRLTFCTKSGKSQSALEFLTTYSWAILIIVVALSALYLLGAFSPSNYVSAFCTLPAQLSCLGTTLANNGNLLVNIGQSIAPTITLTSIGCNTNGIISNMQTNGLPVSVTLGGNVTILTQCYENGTVAIRKIGNLYIGYLIINYTNLATGYSHTAIGTLIVKVSTLTAFTSTSTASTTTSTTSTSTTSTTISSFTYAWTSQANTLAVGEYEFSCVTANNYIYCMGGIIASANVIQYASIPSGGGPTYTWTSQSTNTIAFGADSLRCVTANNYIYCMGGWSGGAYTVVQYASIPSGGGPTSAWTSQANTLASAAYYHSCVTANNYIYCMGGAGAPSAVQYASIPSGGGPTSAWTSQTTNTLAVGEYYFSCVTANNYIYCMGGATSHSVVQYASIPSGGGPTSAWTSQANTLAVGASALSCVTANNYIYCTGSANVVQYASIPSGGGPTSAWTSQTTNTLAAVASYHSCVTANNYIYCMGGASAQSVVQYALS